MKLLISKKDGTIIHVADDIQFGIYENERTPKWAMYENGRIVLYAIDNGYEAVDYNEQLPSDIDNFGKYLYKDGSVIQNPDWVYIPDEETQLKEQVADLEATLDDLLTNIIPMLMSE